MKLSTKGRYGLRALVELVHRSGNGPVLLDAVAKAQGLSRKYLHALFTRLKAAGIIRSIRGARGGYVLARDPAQITILEVLEALEGPMAVTDCVLDAKVCEMSGDCSTRGIWTGLSRTIEAYLVKFTVQDIVEGKAP